MAHIADFITGNMGNDRFWHYAGIVLLAFLAAVNGRIGHYGSFSMIVYKLPCTILHELSHLLAGFLTGGHPSGFSIIPRREMTGDRVVWRLGAVTLTNPGSLSCFPTGLAPLLYIPAAYGVYRNWPDWFPSIPAWIIGMYLTIGIMLGSAVPSGADVRVAFSSFRGTVFYLTVISAFALIPWLAQP